MGAVQQLLHGYSDGHRLLAASSRLPREVEHTLLVLTDISGPVTAGAFDSYLTGCPIPGTRAYAFSRTWLASELHRPGCVWTHTLLLDVADLGAIPDLGVLRDLFRRPRKGEPLHLYGEPLPLPTATPTNTGAGRGSPREASRLAAALYGFAAAPTLVEAERPDRFEELIVAIWSQQWPRLRRSFRFCTWSLATRSIHGEPFDLQVLPASTSRQLKHGRMNATLLNLSARFGTEAEFPPLSPWAERAARDLLGDSDGTLRDFLWRFAADVASLRAAFAPLVEIERQLDVVASSRVPVGDLLRAVAAGFPAPPDARELKFALFGDPVARAASRLSSLSEATLLQGLATTEHHDALDGEALGIARRGAALWLRDRERALELARTLASSSSLTPFGEQFLAGVAAAVTPPDGATLHQQAPALFMALLGRNPKLAAAAPAPSHSNAPAATSALGGSPTRTPPAAGADRRPLSRAEGQPAASAAPYEIPPTAVCDVVRRAPVSESPPPPRPRLEREAEPVETIGPQDEPVAPARFAGERTPVRGAAEAEVPVPGPADGAAPPVEPPPGGSPATPAEILALLDGGPDARASGLPSGWQAILERHPGEVADWFSRAAAPRPLTVAIVANALDPGSADVRRLGPEPWLRAIARVGHEVEGTSRVRLMAFLLALALTESEPEAAELAARAFYTVDRAAATGELPDDAWARLVDLLPTLPWWREWDRSERLRRALVDRFLRHGWPPEQLLLAGEDAETFQRLIEVCEWSREGESLLRRLGAQVSRGAVEASAAQRAALVRYSGVPPTR